MQRKLMLVLALILLAVALLPALAAAGPVPIATPTPTPEPLYIQLEPGQSAYILCPAGLKFQGFGMQAGMLQCR